MKKEKQSQNNYLKEAGTQTYIEGGKHTKKAAPPHQAVPGPEIYIQATLQVRVPFIDASAPILRKQMDVFREPCFKSTVSEGVL